MGDLEQGASVPDQALVASDQARAGLGPSGFDPSRIQLRRTKGWRMPDNTVKVDRTNKKFGNPFAIGCNPSQFSTALPSHCETAADAVAAFSYYAETWMELTRGHWITPLIGKNLACWCKPGDPCHADVLLKLARDSDGNPKGGDGTAPSRSDDSAGRKASPESKDIHP